MNMVCARTLRRRFAIERKLYVHDSGKNYYNTEDVQITPAPFHSGIRATIFGASGVVGFPIATKLGQIGSDVIMPLNNDFHFRHAEHTKILRHTGQTNKCYIEWHLDLKNQKQVSRLVSNSNVVINLLGPRTCLKTKEQFQFINIEAAERIAHACAKRGVLRLIHFSAAGADPNSESLDFRTKYYGEQAVRKAFPAATIFRPCPVYGWNDRFSDLIRRQSSAFFHRFVLAYDSLQTVKQPIKAQDVATCILNALKLHESRGKTYELGGPQHLTMLQIHEQIFNYLRIQPTIGYVHREFAMRIAKDVYNWDIFSLESIKKSVIEEIVKPEKYLTCKDLFVEPVRFKYGMCESLVRHVLNVRELEEDQQV